MRCGDFTEIVQLAREAGPGALRTSVGAACAVARAATATSYERSYVRLSTYIHKRDTPTLC